MTGWLTEHFYFFDFRALNPECQSARTSKPNKKLRYCRETAPRAMLVNSCYVSRGMGVKKVSNSKRDFQGHSRALTMVPFDRPHTNSY